MSDKPSFDWNSDDAGFEEDEKGPKRPRDCGPHADDYDHFEKPRRVQMNVKIADEIKERFAEAVEADNKTMQFVVEDLLRLYLKDRE